MIFVTVGSQKFQFNRLIREVDNLVEDNSITESVFAQIGCSDYTPIHYPFETYLSSDAFEEYINRADIIITHGGTGIIITAIKRKKIVIAVPRLKKYSEHVDDHQTELIEQFVSKDLICSVNECTELRQTITQARKRNFNMYDSNTNMYIDSIEKFIREGWK